jgi:hypothetical protein
VSLNTHCVELLQSGEATDRERLRASLRPALAGLKREFGPGLLGCVLFGSRARGEASDTSDADLLVIVRADIALRRSLYRRWDGRIPQQKLEINPHFVHTPAHAHAAGSLWLESAVDGILLSDTKGKISRALNDIRKAIEDGAIRRYWSHGHPFWRREDHEEQVAGA